MSSVFLINKLSPPAQEALEQGTFGTGNAASRILRGKLFCISRSRLRHRASLYPLNPWSRSTCMDICVTLIYYLRVAIPLLEMTIDQSSFKDGMKGGIKGELSKQFDNERESLSAVPLLTHYTIHYTDGIPGQGRINQAKSLAPNNPAVSL